jgi:ATP-dependent helicase/nuclease subunit A
VATETGIPDQAERARALDPTTSFIVQAPAGSGKTELLVQRYLALLASVEAPEEIIAITFTNKAAGEMRGRILEALARAGDPEPPSREHARLTWMLARAVLGRDASLGWEIAANPRRLRVQTIDALCAALTRQMPWLSRFGAQPAVSQDPAALYSEAARGTLAELETGHAWSAAVEQLLKHLDNDIARVESLLAEMLGRRDQWLRHVTGGTQRGDLEAGLAAAIGERLQGLSRALTDTPGEELVALACYAAANLRAQPAPPDLAADLELRTLPGADLTDLPAWRAVAELLLTRNGEWRRAVNASLGFPPPSGARELAERSGRADMKGRFQALIARLAGDEDLRLRLDEVRRLPPPAYQDHQWGTVEALFELLRLAVAHLRLVFRARGEVDFTEVALAALEALGTPEAPTDLALALDYRISHLLVDEFQDTSLSQHELLARLTAGWEPGDGRTLFAVGDPMQSIYRFREAEVGLYLRARQEGLGSMVLEPLVLRANFRSQQGIVDWVNEAFPRVLPAEVDLGAGAVPYAPSVAVHPGLDGAAVTVHPFFGDSAEREAERVVALVGEARKSQPDGSVVILVRSRTHLSEIVPRLREAGLRFRAVEIEGLGQQPVVQDLLALTRALLHPADRIAWLAVLRASWCGLGLPELHALAGGDFQRTIWDLMNAQDARAAMSDAGRQRLDRVRGVLADSLVRRRRQGLRRWVEGTWVALGGPACLSRAGDLQDAEAFFDRLEALEEGGDLADPVRLGEEVAGLYARPDLEAEEGLQIMTIHKAKGLEFDTVIVPGLGRVPPHETERLLMWLERPRVAGSDTDLLLAPIMASGEVADPIYDYLKGLHQQRVRHEDGRLLYVAATRARARLHLLGHVQRDAEGGVRQPAAGSLLSRLWPAVRPEFDGASDAASETAAGGMVAGASVPPAFWRLPLGWQAVAPADPVPWERLEAEEEEPRAEVEFLWARETIRHVGTVVHRLLQHVVRDGPEAWDERRVMALERGSRAALAALGVPPDDLDGASERAMRALRETMSDLRGRWILDPAHQEARSEYALSGRVRDAVVHVVIDRSFVDSDGVRWIIDYKTSIHEGGDVKDFLNNEQLRYQAQLERYAALVGQGESRPIRLGLYFPLLRGWREWPWLR